MITGEFTVTGASMQELEMQAEDQIIMFMGHMPSESGSGDILEYVKYDIHATMLSQDRHSWRITQWSGKVNFTIP